MKAMADMSPSAPTGADRSMESDNHDALSELWPADPVAKPIPPTDQNYRARAEWRQGIHLGCAPGVLGAQVHSEASHRLVPGYDEQQGAAGVGILRPNREEATLDERVKDRTLLGSDGLFEALEDSNSKGAPPQEPDEETERSRALAPGPPPPTVVVTAVRTCQANYRTLLGCVSPDTAMTNSAQAQPQQEAVNTGATSTDPRLAGHAADVPPGTVSRGAARAAAGGRIVLGCDMQPGAALVDATPEADACSRSSSRHESSDDDEGASRLRRDPDRIQRKYERRADGSIRYEDRDRPGLAQGTLDALEAAGRVVMVCAREGCTFLVTYNRACDHAKNIGRRTSFEVGDGCGGPGCVHPTNWRPAGRLRSQTEMLGKLRQGALELILWPTGPKPKRFVWANPALRARAITTLEASLQRLAVIQRERTGRIAAVSALRAEERKAQRRATVSCPLARRTPSSSLCRRARPTRQPREHSSSLCCRLLPAPEANMS